MSSTITSRAAGALLIISLVACGRQSQVSSPAGAPPAPAQSAAITDGESLVRAMHDRYAGRWYNTLTYTQTTALLGQTGASSEQTWYVANSLPGRMRIDYGNPDLHNGILFRADTSYQFSNGSLGRTASGWNELLMLTQDVYHQPPELTSSVLRSLGFQMSRLRTGNFDGRTAYIVGSSTVADSSSRQFWIERDRLILVRIREKRPDGHYTDIRLGDFTQAGNGWMAKQIYQFLDGMPRLHQQAGAIRPDAALDPALFDPTKFATVKHWSKP